MKYNEMKKKLIEASDEYYNKSISTMSDQEFDELKDEFTRLYPNDDFITQIGSPVSDNSHWGKAKHEIQMTSLDKVTDVKSFKEWLNKIYKKI